MKSHLSLSLLLLKEYHGIAMVLMVISWYLKIAIYKYYGIFIVLQDKVYLWKHLDWTWLNLDNHGLKTWA